MTDAAERLVNLALFLAATPRPITAEECRSAGLGYPEGQDDGAFIRMFERDKDALRAAGLVISVAVDGETEAYRLDASATYARPVALAADEVSVIHAVGAALADDTSFPFREDLALAIGKLTHSPLGDATRATTADARPRAGEGADARALAEAVTARKWVTFGYTNALGSVSQRRLEPYGMFFREGSWYVAGHDVADGVTKTFAVGRIRDLAVNAARQKSPDFDRPIGFDVADHERLPFQIGPVVATAVVRFDADVAWRAEGLARGRGTLVPASDGSAEWTVEVADLGRLASWLVKEGPGLVPAFPPELGEELAAGLRVVAARHA